MCPRIQGRLPLCVHGDFLSNAVIDAVYRRMKMRRMWLLAAGVLGCGGSGETAITPPSVSVESVAVTSATVPVLIVGNSTRLTASALDAQRNVLSGRPIAWSSSAAQIAAVSADGVVSAVSPGTATIRATSDGKFAEVGVTVRPQPWSLTGSLATGRALLSLTLLENGSVLAAGGQVIGTPFQTLRTSELYDPATGTWRAAGSLTTGRANHLAVRLRNGKVLVAGGYSIELSTRLASAELYDPVTNVWSTTGSMTEPRNLPEAALLPDGRVLVAGGSGAGTDLNALATAEIFDPASGTWSRTTSLSAARAGHTTTALPNGRVLVAGGASGAFSAPSFQTTAELFDATTGVWSAAGSVGVGRGYHRAVALPAGRLLMIGGSDIVSTVFPATDLYDVATGVWASSAPLGAGRTSHSATVLPDGRVLVAGGGASAPLGSTELFDVTAGRWTTAGDMRVPRSNHRAVLLPNGQVLVVGGQGVGASTTAEIYDPG